jgi:8-oxo-dGTP pyrophosphatase MutT (NUDIX family)
MLQGEIVSLDRSQFHKDDFRTHWGSEALADQLSQCLVAIDLATIEFQNLSPKPLMRSHLPWHVSASSVVFRQSFEPEFLVLFHAKAKEWVYPGGHADGDVCLLNAALREVEEETSQTPIRIWFKKKPDSLTLPDFAQEILIDNPLDGRHSHLDVVYCFEFGMDAQVKVDLRESKDYRWIKRSEFEAMPVPTLRALLFFHEMLSPTQSPFSSEGEIKS